MSNDDTPPISTGKGDDGTTTLMGAGRLSKGAPEVSVLGDIDEASSFLGLARAEAAPGISTSLLQIQRLLYRIMGDIAMTQEANTIGAAEVETVDDLLERWRTATELPREFVIPGESRQGALLDVCRSVVRRAERGMVAAGLHEGHPHSLRVMNRLSDVLFVLARAADGDYRPSRDDR